MKRELYVLSGFADRSELEQVCYAFRKNEVDVEVYDGTREWQRVMQTTFTYGNEEKQRISEVCAKKATAYVREALLCGSSTIVLNLGWIPYVGVYYEYLCRFGESVGLEIHWTHVVFEAEETFKEAMRREHDTAKYQWLFVTKGLFQKVMSFSQCSYERMPTLWGLPEQTQEEEESVKGDVQIIHYAKGVL